jgi:nitroreductase/NAD-dependent dihydropyrimidine dehydrogenase PreA subunit
MIDFRIDKERCVQCGECALDCPMQIISMGSGYPEVPPEKESTCINCQHCLAICPSKALSIHGSRPEDSLPLDSLPRREELETLVMGRRSVRRYSAEPVDKEEIDRLLQVASYAPAARNNETRLLTVVDDADVMDQYRKLTYHGLSLAAKNNQIPQSLAFFSRLPEAFAQGRDVIFRGAPHMLAVSSPKDGPAPEADCFICLSSFDLLAAGAGLGTLWCGLAKWAMEIVPEMRIALGIPGDHALGYVMLFGKPAAKYRRTVQRAPANVRRLKIKS